MESQHQPDFSKPPVVLPDRRDNRSLVRKRAIFFSSVLSTFALFVVFADVHFQVRGSTDYWMFNYDQWKPIHAFFLLLLPIVATIRQYYIKPADMKVIWNAFIVTTLLLVGPFSMLNPVGIFTFDFQRLGSMFIGYLIGICVVEVLGMGCELVLKVFWNWISSLNLTLNRARKPPMRVASEAQDLTEAEPTVSNQQSR